VSRTKANGTIVVDASVAHSAGGEDATHAQAIACRDGLQIIYEVELRLVMSRALYDEWSKHCSRYARKWLHRMFGHRRVAQLEPAEHQPTRIALLKFLSHSEQATLLKDLLLVDAALAANGNILSLDDRTRHLLVKLAPHVRQLRALHWASPNTEGCLNWLRARLPMDARFAVG